MTLVGPTLVVAAGATVTIGLAGADLGARIRNGRRLAPGRSHRLAGGDIVEIPGDRSGPSGPGPSAAGGSRAYLAVPGGIDVPIVLGSRSTCLAGAFGGFGGRPLRTGDRISAVMPGRTEIDAPQDRGPAPFHGPWRPELVWPEASAVRGDRGTRGAGVAGVSTAMLRVIAGPSPGIAAVANRDWHVGSATDRVGVRLDGEPVADGIGGDGPSRAMLWGAIQIPPDGLPIVLGADHQTTGGYRVVGVVISADLPILGQLRPGDPVRLVATDRAAALDALRVQREALVAGSAALREAAGWGALIDSAGG
jgi:antagonist of KipI